MNPKVCCRDLHSGDESPFEILMLGWQDGLTSGMARCRSCGTTFHFEMVAWDGEQEIRIYGFREVSRASYDAVASLHAGPPADTHSRERADALTLKVRDALATSFERMLYVAAKALAQKIVAARWIEFALWKEMLRF
jgi:hypothetical protein